VYSVRGRHDLLIYYPPLATLSSTISMPWIIHHYIKRTFSNPSNYTPVNSACFEHLSNHPALFINLPLGHLYRFPQSQAISLNSCLIYLVRSNGDRTEGNTFPKLFECF
jgi:hypothetical protein